MKKVLFQGAGTALITPFKDNKVDYDALKKLVEFQVDQGISALIICGTTGESATLDDDEHLSVIEHAVKYVNGRVPVIAGTGSNNTAHAVMMSRESEKLGADGLLLVTPYYNKTTQIGLVRHFNTIADATGLPAIVYNVPSRTGVNIMPETYKELSKHPNLVAAKEANGDLVALEKTISLCKEDLAVYSGNDDQIVPILKMGGKGVISVLSNFLPGETDRICKAFFEGDVAAAEAMQEKYQPLIKALFCEVNPIPVKAAMAYLGYSTPEIRLPLVEPEPVHFELIKEELRKAGVVR